MTQNTMTIHSTATKKFLFISFFAILITIFVISFLLNQKPTKNLDELLFVEEVPRFDIKTNNNDNYKKREYTNATFSLNGIDFSGKIKARGSSSYSAAKDYNAPYPYRLKLNKKYNLLGLGEADSFILLPNFIDPSGIRQFFHYNLAYFVFDDWSPRTKYVELYIDDKYSGLYLLAETIEKSDNKIKYKNEFGFIVEMDIQGKLEETTEPFVSEKSFAIDYQIEKSEQLKNITFELKNPKSFSETNQKQKQYILDETTNLYENQKNVDINSFVNYFMLNEIYENNGIGLGSVFYWNDGEKMHAGPFWDADRITTSHEATGFIKDNYDVKNPVYEQLLENAEFKQKYKNSFEIFYNNTYPKIQENLNKLKNNSTLKSAWEKNENLYHRLSRKDIIDDFISNKEIESRKTFESQIDYIIDFYNKRINWLHDNLK